MLEFNPFIQYQYGHHKRPIKKNHNYGALDWVVLPGTQFITMSVGKLANNRNKITLKQYLKNDFYRRNR